MDIYRAHDMKEFISVIKGTFSQGHLIFKDTVEYFSEEFRKDGWAKKLNCGKASDSLYDEVRDLHKKVMAELEEKETIHVPTVSILC